MNTKNVLIAFLSIVISATLHAQDKPWNNKKCAVVLTYDDAMPNQLDYVIPLLDSLGLKGTFYLTGYSNAFGPRIKDWRKAALKGHELGNHTLFHPCIGGTPGREWVKPEYDLSKYTIQKIRDELRMTNTLLTTLDGKTKRTMAYTCGDEKINDSLYLDQKDFVSARGVQSSMPLLQEVNLYDVPAYGINGETGEQLIALVKQAMEKKALLVFLFHGVGGDHSLNVSLQAHRELLKFLKQNLKDIWVGTFMDVTQYIRKQQAKQN
jgi:sialate O-acetylesterase